MRDVYTRYQALNPMRCFALIAVLVLPMLTGCATRKHPKYQRGEGDAGAFIVKRAVDLGAERVSTGALPPVYSAWQYKDFGSAVVVRLPGEERAALDRVLREAFCQRQDVPFYEESGLLFDALPIGPGFKREYHLLPSPVRIGVLYNNRRLQATVMLDPSVRELVESVDKTTE